MMIGNMILKRVMRDAFYDLSKGDMESFTRAWVDDAVYIYPGTAEVSGIYIGKEEISRFFIEMFKRFPRRQFTIKKICAEKSPLLNKCNTVFVYVEERLTNRHGEVFVFDLVSVIQMQRLKAYKVTEFIDDTETLKKAWS